MKIKLVKVGIREKGFDILPVCCKEAIVVHKSAREPTASDQHLKK